MIVLEKKSDNNYCIDFYRFVFSFILIFYHSWMFTGVYSNGIFNYGFYAVDFYFIVTGYLMINTINKDNRKKYDLFKDTFEFIYKKIIRLLPAMIIAFIIGIILVFGKNFEFKILFSDSVVGELLQLGIFGYDMPINSSWWYISAMILCLMILYPIAKKNKEKYIFYIAPLILFITLMFVRKKGIWINDPLNSQFYLRNGFYKAMIFIILGNFSFYLANMIRNNDNSKIRIIILSIIEFLIYGLLIYNMHYNIIGSILEALLFAFAVALTFSNSTISKNIFKSSFWKKLGTFGFYMFLCQISIRTYLMRHNTGNYGEMLLRYILMTLIISLIIYIIVEIIYKKIIYKKKC